MWTENIPLHNSDLASPGPWRAAGGLENPTVQVSGINGGTVTIEGSNDRGMGDDPDITNAHQLGDPITADGIYTIDAGARWIRATSTDADTEVILAGQGHS